MQANKYLIFAFDRYYPHGGICDLWQVTTNLSELNVDELIEKFDEVQIVDYSTLSVLYTHSFYEKTQSKSNLIEFINDRQRTI